MLKLILLTTILIGLIIIFLKKKKKKALSKLGDSKCPLLDNDYNRVKSAPLLKCVECQGCIIESTGCCANCNQAQSIENHCQEHNHSHDHHHHHSPVVDLKGLLPLLLVPLILGLASYKIYQKLWKKI